jgi:hypothetical protein
MSDDELIENGLKKPYKKPEIIKGTDLVPVVRCRDCKHWDNGNLSFECPWDYGRYGSSDEDDFCSYGERKE